MPQVQIFFIVTPLTILVGFALLAILIGGMMTAYLSQFQAHMAPFIG
jgi:flagellar biosynthetic protein FliR